MNRRDFIKRFLTTTTGVAASGVVLPHLTLKQTKSDRLGELLPLRALGKTGDFVTIFGLGGSHVGDLGDKNELKAQEAIETALEGGVRFFDTAEMYQAGNSERYFGKFLTPKYRDVIYLMSKTTAKDAKTAREHLEGSLRRMKTDYLDLWKIHAVRDAEDVDTRIANGVLDVFLKAKSEGKIRHIGFSGHRELTAHLRMLEKTDAIETCQMPINVVDPSYKSFILNVLPKLSERKIGVLAMKTAAYGKLFEKNIVPQRISIEQMHYFVWSLPVSTMIGGFDTIAQLKERIRLARSFKRLSESKQQEIIDKVADLAGDSVEFYKTKW